MARIYGGEVPINWTQIGKRLENPPMLKNPLTYAALLQGILAGIREAKERKSAQQFAEQKLAMDKYRQDILNNYYQGLIEQQREANKRKEEEARAKYGYDEEVSVPVLDTSKLNLDLTMPNIDMTQRPDIFATLKMKTPVLEEVLTKIGGEEMAKNPPQTTEKRFQHIPGIEELKIQKDLEIARLNAAAKQKLMEDKNRLDRERINLQLTTKQVLANKKSNPAETQTKLIDLGRKYLQLYLDAINKKHQAQLAGVDTTQFDDAIRQIGGTMEDLSEIYLEHFGGVEPSPEPTSSYSMDLTTAGYIPPTGQTFEVDENGRLVRK